MSRTTDRSVTVLTGLIIAALYVIMLVGFSRESYMQRDFMRRHEASALPEGFGGGKAICRVERIMCPSDATSP